MYMVRVSGIKCGVQGKQSNPGPYCADSEVKVAGYMGQLYGSTIVLNQSEDKGVITVSRQALVV
jgi:hypothetical protein